MKLFTKYNRINLSVMVVVFLLSGILYYFLLSRVLVRELDEVLGEYRDRVSNYVKQHHKMPEFTSLDDVVVNLKPVTVAQKTRYYSTNRLEKEDNRIEHFRELVFVQNIDGQLYELRVAKPVEGTRLITKTIAFTTLILLLVVILISLAVNQIILKKLWRPYYLTMQELKGFKLNSKASPNFPPSDIEEFSFLNKSLSDVINSAKDDYQTLKEFTENASHELQTPLAIIRSKLDLVIQEEGLSEQQSAALKSAYKGIHRLTKLNQSLLLLAKIENQQFAATEEIDLREKIQEKISQFMEFWEANDIKVVADLQLSTINANSDLIEILLNNLLSNAGRHNVQGGEINISLNERHFSVRNSGGEKSLDTTKLFSRFYKEASSSSTNGLGLSIVKQICEQSGIEIQYKYDQQAHRFILSW